MTPPVTVIIPVFNRAAVIGRAIGSVLRQSFTDFEVIVVDDGSTDGSVGAVLACRDPRIRLIRHERNQGAAAARNTGIAASAGRLIAFLDSDDVWHPTKLERQIPATDALPTPATTCTDFRLLHPSGRSEVRSSAGTVDWRTAFLDGCYVSPGTTLLAHRQAFETAGVLDAALKRLEDWDWLLRLVRVGSFAVVPEALADVHLGGRPNADTVREAAVLLWRKHGEEIRRSLGAAAARRFRASLAIEEAVCHLHDHAYLAGTTCGLQAALRSPPRVIRFASGFLARQLARRATAAGGTFP
jgi:glycosyltransferase involved in cell wall biosynthesis